MRSRSKLIDTKHGMIIVDPQSFPVNLGQTGYEDQPEASFRVIPYDGQNVLPTALGYKSYFSDTSLINVPEVPSQYCQDMILWQSPVFSTYAIALCEEGIYFCNATDGEATPWTLIYATGNDPATQVRHLWTTAIVANKLCVYSQGEEKYWIFTDLASANNMVSQAELPQFSTAEVTLEYSTPLQLIGIVSVKPTFINMAGQMGLFKAANRLGFWDSDGAVAWSSPTQLFDMTPSTETFAGVTTFSAVQGPITKVVGHGDGFIIYSSKSVVMATPVTGSPERWAGRAILSDTGVAYDTQISAAEPDTEHYALTSSGLVKISRGQPTFISTEVSDYLLERDEVVSVKYLDGRYLFLYTTNDLLPAKIEVEVVQVVDHENDGYYMLPTIPYAPGNPSKPVFHWDFNGTDPVAWDSDPYRDNNNGAWSPLHWSIQGGKLQLNNLASHSFGFVVYGFRVQSIFATYPEAPSPEAPRIMAWTADLVVSLSEGAEATFIYYVDGDRVTEVITHAMGTRTIKLRSPAIIQTNLSDLPIPNPGTEFGVWELLRIESVSVGEEDSSIITLDNIHIDVPGVDDASDPVDTVGHMVQGKSSLVQDGFANFSSSDPSLAFFVKNNEVPLIPCYSGGDFKSDWMERVERVLREETLPLLLPHGIVLNVKVQVPYIQTPFTLTRSGPTYTDPTTVGRVRIVDQAGEDILETFSAAGDRLNYQLIATANDVLSFIPDKLGDQVKATVATPITPYPASSSVANIVLDGDNAGIATLLQDVAIPSTGALKLTECAIMLSSAVQDVEFNSYAAGVLILQQMYVTNWEVTYSQPSGKTNIAVGVMGPFEAMSLPGGGSWFAGAAEIREQTTGARAFSGQYVADSFNRLLANPAHRGVVGEGSYAPTATELAAIGSEALLLASNSRMAGYDSNNRFTVLPAGSFTNPAALVANMKAKRGYSVALYDLSSFSWPTSLGEWTLQSVEYSPNRWALDLNIGSVTLAVSNQPSGWTPMIGTVTYDFSEGGWVRGVYRNEVGTIQSIQVADRLLTIYNSDNPVVYLKQEAPSNLPEPLKEIYERLPPLPSLGSVDSPVDDIKDINWFEQASNISVRASDWVMDDYQQRCDWEWVGEASEKDHLSIEVSGYGYLPGPDETFRKTHNRNSSTSCPYPGELSIPIALNDVDKLPGTFSPTYPNYTGKGTNPGYNWPFPEPIPFPDTYALFRKGSIGLFYPTYKAAVFWDSQLDKWGRYSNEHKILLTLMPVNRAEGGVLPTKDLGLRAGSLRPDGRITIFSGEGRRGSIRWGRMGDYRLGWTYITKVIIRFAEPAFCNVLIEPSLDGASIHEESVQGATVDGLIQVEIPFTMAAKWFNIHVDGVFNIVGIQLESSGTSRR